MKDEEKYWLVHSPGAGPAHYVHKTQKEAEQEAERLAMGSVGTEFFILETTKKVVASFPVKWN